VAITEEAIETKTKDLGCLWIAPTNDIVVSRNTKCFKALVAEEKEFFRFFATHQQERLYELPKEVELNLRRNTNKDCLQPILDLAIGSRIRVTRNKAAFLGLYNGALGTVIGIRFFGNVPFCRALPKDYYGSQPHAIILVEMDDVDITCDRTRPRIVSFGRHEDHDRRIKGTDGRSYIRSQFPLECAHASTIHKSQGIFSLRALRCCALKMQLRFRAQKSAGRISGASGGLDATDKIVWKFLVECAQVACDVEP
jgi:hypothetical protein